MRLPVFDVVPVARNLPGLETGPRSIAAVRMLRISITDRCNYRCLYCMPAEGVAWMPREEILSFEEICDVVRAAIEIHGIRRFKLTGGEPTVRHGLVELVAMLRRINGIEDLSLTTNGQRLAELAYPLYDAGLDRLTISLDSLQPEKFRRITRTGDLTRVLHGLDQCEEAGFIGTKLNCVTMRGTNDDELVDFARLTLKRNVTVRFIEYMPLGDAAISIAPRSPVGRALPAEQLNGGQFTPCTGSSIRGADHRAIALDEIGPAGGCGAQDRGQGSLIPEAEVRAVIEAQLGPLVPVARGSEPGVGPANVYRLALGDPCGRVGFISAMSAPFCATCNRLRLTANGLLRSCLFEGGEVDIRPIVRETRERAEKYQRLADAMSECVRLKPDVHGSHGNQQMSRIGG